MERIKNDSNYDYLFRILLLGDSGVGKSSIILRYSVNFIIQDNTFQDSIMASIGVEFKLKNLQLNNKKVKMQIVGF